jgi:kumamolisin
MLTPFSILETTPLGSLKKITINLLLRRPNCLKDYADSIVDGEHNNILSHENFDQQFGATSEDIQTVINYATLNGLNIVDAHSGSRTIKVSGTVGQFNSIFNITLTEYVTEDRSYFDYTGMLTIPAEIKEVVEYVIGLSTKRSFVNHAKFFNESSTPAGSSLHPNLTTVTPQQVATAYNFPAGDGAGQCIGILELGGGYLSSDVALTFSAMGLTPPTMVDVLVSGGLNSPANDNASFENILDIACAGGVAPKAKLAMYYAPNTSQGFIDGIAAAIHDTANNPSILSVSWASYEQYEDISYVNAFEDMLHSAVVKGITVLFAAGDDGSETFIYYGNNQEVLPAVGYPASSPYVLACGGTSLELNTGTNTIAAEYVWNELTPTSGLWGAGNGGISNIFTVPSYQAGLTYKTYAGDVHTLTMRGIPDISGNADKYSGYKNLYVSGISNYGNGTSSVAPLYAGLIARINAIKGVRLGFANRLFYANPGAFRVITSGHTANPAPKKIDTTWSISEPDQMYLGTRVVVTATVYNFNYLKLWFEIGDSNQTNPQIALFTTSTNLTSQNQTVTFTSPVFNTPLNSKNILGYVYGYNVDPYIGKEIALDYPVNSGIPQVIISFSGNYIKRGDGCYALPGTSLTVSGVVYNAIGQTLKFTYFDGGWHDMFTPITSSPQSYSTTVTLNNIGGYTFYLLDQATNGSVFIRTKSIAIVNADTYSVLQPGTPIPFGYQATNGWSAATGLGSINGTSLLNTIPTSSRGFGMLFPKSKKTRPSNGIMWPRM